MPDLNTTTTEATAAAQAPATGHAPQTMTLTADEYEKRLQSEVDRRVAQAAETLRKKDADKQASLRAEAEKKSLEERGEFDRLKEIHERERNEARAALTLERVQNALQAVALAGDSPVRDVADLRLLDPVALAGCASDDGKVDREKVAALVTQLRESKPYLFDARNQPTPAQPGPKGAPSPGNAAPATLHPEGISGAEAIQMRAAHLTAAKNLQGPDFSQMLQHMITQKK